MSNKPPLWCVSLAFNYSRIGHGQVGVGEAVHWVEDSYVPLLDILDKHPEVKANFFFMGWTDEKLSREHPEVVERVKRGVKEGRFGIGTYTYSHLVTPLFPYEDVERQIAKGIEWDQKVWGVKPKCFIAPENTWDPILPKILKEHGIEWIYIAGNVYRESLPSYEDVCSVPRYRMWKVWYEENDLYHPLYAEGIEGTKIIAIPIAGTVAAVLTKFMPLNLSRIIFGAVDIDDTLQSLEGVEEKFNQKGDAMVAFKADGDILAPIIAGKDGRLRLDKFLTALEGVSYIKFTNVEDYLKRVRPIKTVGLKAISGHAPLSVFYQGPAYRMTVLCRSAREEIHNAEYVLMLAEKLGADVLKSKELLEKAWVDLLRAELSDVYTYWTEDVKRPPSLAHRVCEQALRARELAREAVAILKIQK